VKRYPLVYSFRDLIAGNGFVAVVSIDGRVLLEEEEDGDVWMYGVQPGGVAAGKTESTTVFTEFKKAYLSVLFDIAAEATSFDTFKAEVTTFFETVNDAFAKDWDLLVAAVRRENTTLPDLKTVKSESKPPRLLVEEAAPAKIDASANEFDQIFQLSAAA
jgi:hypothetical protein